MGVGLLSADGTDFLFEHHYSADASPQLDEVIGLSRLERTSAIVFRNATPALAEALRIEVVNDAIFFCVPVITIGAIKESD